MLEQVEARLRVEHCPICEAALLTLYLGAGCKPARARRRKRVVAIQGTDKTATELRWTF